MAAGKPNRYSKNFKDRDNPQPNLNLKINELYIIYMPYPKQVRHYGPLIYKLTAPNGKSYIGQTIECFEVRMNKHKSSSKHREASGCLALNAAIRKYTFGAFSKEILIYCNKEDLDMYEERMIKLYNTISPHGYNLLSGGNSNKSQSTETKERMSMSRLRISVQKGTACISYGCLIKYTARTETGTKTKYAILDHPLCEFKSFDTLSESEDYLIDLNHELYKKDMDFSEYDCSDENLVGSSKNTFADITSVLNNIVSDISKQYLKEDRWKRTNNQI